MWALIAPFLGKILGLLALAAGALAIYLGIKRRGTLEEREKWEKATSEAKIEAQERVLGAISKDSEIDAKAEDEKLRIKEAAKKPPDSDPDTFTF